MSSRKNKDPVEDPVEEPGEEPEEDPEEEPEEEPGEEAKEPGQIQIEDLNVSVLLFGAFVCYFVCYIAGVFLELWDYYWFINSLFVLGALAFVYFLEEPWARFKQD